MSEGEKLSQTIMEHEAALKRLRASIKDKDAAAAKASVALAAEKQRVDTLTSEKEHLVASLAASQASVRDIVQQTLYRLVQKKLQKMCILVSRVLSQLVVIKNSAMIMSATLLF